MTSQEMQVLIEVTEMSAICDIPVSYLFCTYVNIDFFLVVKASANSQTGHSIKYEL